MKKINIRFAALIVTLLTACSAKDKKIAIASVNWAEGIAMTQLSKVLLEEEGYKVVVKNADVAPVFAAVASADADVFLDAWLPVTHKEYLDKYGDRLEILGTNFNNARIGFVVPDGSAINCIDELNANAAAFKGKIVGIDAGAGIMSKAVMALKAYGIKLELQTSSEAAMLAILKKNIDAKEPVVVTGWSPHYIFGQYHLKFLEDPKGVFGAVEQIQTIANKEFVRSNPVVAGFFKNFRLDEQELSSLLAALNGSRNERQAVVDWLGEHADFAEHMRSFLKAPEQK